MYYDEANERENRLMDIPLTEELKRKNPKLYDEIVRLRNLEDEGDE